jgi:hypothetical protein
MATIEIVMVVVVLAHLVFVLDEAPVVGVDAMVEAVFAVALNEVLAVRVEAVSARDDERVAVRAGSANFAASCAADASPPALPPLI